TAVLRREPQMPRGSAHRQVEADQRRNLGRPGTGRAHEGGGRDLTGVSLDRPDPAVAYAHSGQRGVLAKAGAAFGGPAGGPRHARLGRAVAVELAEGGGEHALEVELRYKPERLVGRQLAGRNAERLLHRERGPKRIDVLEPVEQEEVAPLVQLDLV